MKSVSEWSNQFDIMYNNITSNQAPGLNEFEKSSFLTKAEKELVKNYFDPNSKGNSLGKGFDESAIRQMDFSNLLESVERTSVSDTPIIDHRALVYELPDNVFIIINEEIALKKEDIVSTRQVIPISFQEYMRLMSKPFKEPLKWQAWRLMTKGGTTNKVEIVLSSVDLKYPTINYIIRYVRKPKPIILTDLSEYGDITIDGYKGNENDINFACELNESTHDAILQRAVELAKIAWAGDANDIQATVTSGQRSE